MAVIVSSTNIGHFHCLTQPVQVSAYGGSSTSANITKALINIYRIGQSTPEVSYLQGPDPNWTAALNTPFMFFDIHEVLCDMVTFPLPDINGFILDATDNLAHVRAGIVGYYMDSTGNWHQYSEVFFPSASPYWYGTNTTLPVGAAADAMDSYIISANPTAAYVDFLTNSPDGKLVSEGDSEYLAGYSDRNFSSLMLFIEKGFAHEALTQRGLLLKSTGLADAKHYFLGIGPGNINQFQAGYISDATSGYKIWLANMGANIFSDADGGTCEGTVNGLLNNHGSGASHSLAYAHSGTHSASCNALLGVANTDGSFSLMYTSGSNTLDANTDYLFSAYVLLHADNLFSMPSDLTLYCQLSDNTFVEVECFTDTISMSQTNVFERWMPLNFRVSTGATAIAPVFEIRLNMDNGYGLNGLRLYVDDIKLQKAQRMTERRTYMLDKACHSSTSRVHFLNRLGGMDSYTFNASDIGTLSMDRTQFQQYRGWQSTVNARGKKVQSVTSSYVARCTSDALRPEEAKWLEELITSPEVYMQIDGQYIPVIVQNGDFETTNDDLNGISLTVELMQANDAIVQRG